MDTNKNWKEKWGWSDGIKYLIKELKKRKKGIAVAYYAIDAGVCLMKYGATFHDYINLRFYMRNKNERKTFLTTQIVGNEKKKWNQDDIRRIDNKLEFNLLYPEYMGRDFIDLDNTDYEEFESFIHKYNDFFIKPKRESSGIGIMRYKDSDIEDTQAFFKKVNHRGFIAEETVTICDELKQLNPESISQIRVVTVCSTDGSIHILATTLRTGGQNTVFNSAKDDIFAQIDIESGLVFTDGIDENGVLYKKHPISGIEFKGFRIPNWEEIKDICSKAAKKMPTVRVIGWDVTLTDKGCIFFEGNPGSGVASMQIADGIGKKDLFLKYLS